jgi:SAM-dependent methyltransferase
MKGQQEWFEDWFDAPFYPILYQDRDTEEAALFVDKLMSFLHPPKNSKILDIACGEGRFAKQLGSYGHDVTGIDLSVSRIARAKKMEFKKLHFFVHDMRLPFYINYFDYAFNFFTSFGYFEHQRDNQLAANSFASALKPGGVLVLDYLNKFRALEHLNPEESIRRGDYLFHIRRFLQDQKIIKEIRVQDREGMMHFYQERVSAFGLADFISLFCKANMSVEHIFGDYDLHPFEEKTSPRLILVFRKQEAGQPNKELD